MQHNFFEIKKTLNGIFKDVWTPDGWWVGQKVIEYIQVIQYFVVFLLFWPCAEGY